MPHDKLLASTSHNRAGSNPHQLHIYKFSDVRIILSGLPNKTTKLGRAYIKIRRYRPCFDVKT
jgi:hypothetical protein